MAGLSPWWRPDVFAARAPALALRGEIKRAIREHFRDEGFLEVETPALQVSPGNETHISAFATDMIGADGSPSRMFLHASPEFACKKLLAAGVPRLFTFAPVFRNRERGRLHHPEFTMLEWYRAGAPSSARASSPAKRGRGTTRRVVEGAAAAAISTVDRLSREQRPIAEAVAAPSTAFGGPPPPRFAQGRMRAPGGASLDPLMADAHRILRLAAESVGAPRFRHRGAEAEAGAEPEILSVVEAFRRHAGLDFEAMLPDRPDAHRRLAEATRASGLRVASDDTWSDLFSKILSAHVEPKLGHARATFLTRYPASEAALARICPDDPRFAERFELYVCGVELANAFAELNDPGEQRRRFEAAEDERARIYGERYPIDEDFLDALAIMPDACGIALGFDRLVMLATGAEHIEDVLWAPVVEPSP